MRAVACLVPFLVFTVSCTKAWYEVFRAGERNECLAYTGAAYEECVENLDASYDRYRREREKVTGEQAE